MDDKKIKILHLEDSEADVLHVLRVLTEGGIHFASQAVDTREDYIGALREFAPHVVISDHSMPSFNSVEALEILRTSGIDIPFILLTGAVSEEFAAEMMLRGADDYILKDRPKRLPAAIQSNIDKYNQRRERERYQAQLKSIFDGSMDVLCSIDQEGRFITVSAAAEKIWGYKPEELVGKKYMDLVYEADHAATARTDEGITAGTPVTNFENRYVHKNGTVVPMIWSSRWDPEAGVTYAVARDGTEKAKAEKKIAAERGRTMDMFRDAPVSMCLMKGENHVFEMANQHFMNSIDTYDLIGRPAREVLPEIADQGFFDLLDHCYRTGEPYAATELLVKKDRLRTGQPEDMYVNLLFQPTHTPDGRVEGIGYFSVIVTEQVLARKKIEENYESLKAAEALQSSILDSLPAQVALLDSEGKIIAVNQTWKNFAKENKLESPKHGIGESYIAASVSAEGSDADIGRKMAEGIMEVIHGSKKLFSIEYRCDSPTEARWFVARVAPTMLGAERGAVIIHTNITDRKLAEEKIKASEANLTAIIENADALIYSLDREFRFITFNSMISDAMLANYGIQIKPGDKIYGFLESIDPAEARWWEKVYTEALSGRTVTFVKDYSKPGRPYFLNYSISPIVQNEEVTGLACFARDITEKKLSDLEMAQLTSRLSLATTSAGMGIWDWDLTENQITWDEGMYEIYKLEDRSLSAVYEGWLSRLHPDDKEKTNHAIQMAISGQKEYNTEFRIVWNDGSIRHLRATGIVVKDEFGKAIRMIGLNWDITAKKEAENEIKDLNENLEKRIAERTAELNDAIKELEAFNYTVSHDLQAPLRVISGFAGIILDEYGDKVDATCREYLNYISDNAKKMGQLIKDLLAFARLGEVALARELTDMATIVEAIIIQERIARPDMATVFTVGELPPSLSDPVLVRQVWHNLILNAIKYSNKKAAPQVEIGSQLIDGRTVYYVKDNGVGFDMKDADKLFGVFKRLHSPEDFEGSGVGLATVHRILSKHGGQIWAEARVDEGATFYFTLPGSE